MLDASTHKHLIRELRRDLERGKVIVLLGAGVSIQTSNNAATASWRGLLLHGIEHCAAFGNPRPVNGWIEKMRWLVLNGDMEDMLAVATQIERRLQGDKFRNWIKQTIGSIPKVNPELPAAIKRLNAPVATTNYDDYCAVETQCGAVPWTEKTDIDDWLSKNDRRHLHLHGTWRQPESIILGHDSYGRLTRSDRSQFVQKVLGTRKFLMIGCGAGLEDPNLGPLLGWLRDEYSGGERDDYLLCLEKDSQEGGPFVRVPFGQNHSDLVRFLGQIAPLDSKHPDMMDTASYYLRLIERASYDETAVERMVVEIGEHIRDAASDDLFDQLEEGDTNIGLQAGLIWAATKDHRVAELNRILRIANRFEVDPKFSNAKAESVRAFRAMCRGTTDPTILDEVVSTTRRWLSESLVSERLADDIRNLQTELSVRIGAIGVGTA